MQVGNRETQPRKSRLYKTADDLQKAIDAYFDNPDTMDYLYKGEMMQVQVMTVEHIAINHLKFKTKQSLYDYRNRYADEGYKEVVDGMIDRVASWWQVAGSQGNGAFASWVLSKLGRDKERVEFEKDSSSLQKARMLLGEAGKSNISLDTMTKLMAGVKSESDINKVDELERLVRELADMAGIK